MQFGIVSLFPEMFQALEVGITGRAIKKKLIDVNIWNPRDFANDKHKSVDDRPYGGGPGMLMMTSPLQSAIQAAKSHAIEKPTIIYLSPQGKSLDQSGANQLLLKKSLILIAGRYEGIDERLIQLEVDEEYSIGDYILSGGELAAMVMIDVLTRLLPDALGDDHSAAQDSLASGLLKHPQYTRPEHYDGLKVPDVLLSGDHKKIHQWRLKQSLGITWLKRPDLLKKKTLTEEESMLLDEFKKESSQK